MNELESKVGNQSKSISQIFELLKRLVSDDEQPGEEIGFKQKGKG